MKKIISILVLSSLMMIIAAPVVLAIPGDAGIPNSCTMRNTVSFSSASGITCPAAKGVCDYDSTTYQCGMCCVVDAVYNITNWVFFFMMLIVVLMFLYGGFQFLFSQGNPEKTALAQKVLVFAAIGLAVALLAKAVPPLVKLIVGQ